MTTQTRLFAQGRTQPEADTLNGSRAGQRPAESDSKFRDFAIVCTWAVVGIILTVAAAISFGLEMQ
jgi:hypothetical protein